MGGRERPGPSPVVMDHNLSLCRVMRINEIIYEITFLRDRIWCPE